MVVTLRTGRFAWVLLATAAVGGILCLWHFAMVFRCASHFFQGYYGTFIVFSVIELLLAFLIPLGLGAVSTSFVAAQA